MSDDVHTPLLARQHSSDRQASRQLSSNQASSDQQIPHQSSRKSKAGLSSPRDPHDENALHSTADDPELAIAHAGNASSPSASFISTISELKPSSRAQQVRAWVAAPVNPSYSYILLLICYTCAGLTDSAGYSAWQTFLSGQTGNTIFLGLGASGQPTSAPNAWIKSLTSIVCFLAGAALFPRLIRPTGHGGRSRIGLAVSLGLQSCFVAAAAILIAAKHIPSMMAHSTFPFSTGPPTPLHSSQYQTTASSVSSDGLSQTLQRNSDSSLDSAATQTSAEDLRILGGIALLAFQAGGQATLSRALPFSELPTVVLTMCYTDLMGDEHLFARHNPKRTRRALAPVFALAGAVAGGFLLKSNGRMEAVLALAALLKFAMALACLLWPKLPKNQTDPSD